LTRDKKYNISNNRSKYSGKLLSSFSKFNEKITCARINFYNGKYKKRGLTLTEAAESIGISFGYLRRLENTERQEPSSVTIRRLEIFYKFQPGELADLLVKESENAKESAIL
jgi:uncharacterized protein YnzC (UPF0291/DUF896 family)